MVGIKNLKQAINEYKLLAAALDYNVFRADGIDLVECVKLRISKLMQNPSKAFLKAMKAKGYNCYDLEMIGRHDYKQISNLDRFLEGLKKEKALHMLINSESFKQGRLHKLEEFIPKKITSKDELIEYIKYANPSTLLIKALAKNHGKQVYDWLDQASKEGKIHQTFRGWA